MNLETSADFKIEEKFLVPHDERLLHQRKVSEYTRSLLGDKMTAAGAFRQCHLVMRDANGQVVGGAAGHSHLGNFGIENFWVEESYRRFGLGKRLYFAMEDAARRRGCRQIIGSMYDLHGSLAFFLKVGGTRFAVLPSPVDGLDIHYVHKIIS